MTNLASYKNLYRAHGLKRVWTHIRETTLFDWLHGTDTETWKPLSEYAKTDADMKHYQASFTREVMRCFALLKDITDTSAFSFYDVGCGKGKILILAARHLPCAGITGVELSHDLASVAEKNLQKLGINARVVQQNARDFSAYAPRSIVYICDPFGEDTLRQMLTHIKNCCDECLLVYNNPAYSMDGLGFNKIRETSGWHSNYKTSIYQFRK